MPKHSSILIFRNFKKLKGVSSKNPIGLYIGLVCILLICVGVNNQQIVDEFYGKDEHLFHTKENSLKKDNVLTALGTVERVTEELALEEQNGLNNRAGQQKQLPPLKDWFLSTGDWQSSPQLYIREFGSGKDTIVMLHGGWGGDHSGLIDAVRDLQNDYHFILYDQRGSLRSPFPDSLISFNHHIEDLELLRKELKLGKLTIVAHSMGAILASAYAKNYPQRIKHLTLLAPAYLKNPIPDEDKELQHQAYLMHQKYMERPAVKEELTKYNLERTTPTLSSREETSKFRISFANRMLYDISKWPQMMGGRALYKSHVYELTSKTYPKEGWDYLQEFKNRSYPVSIIIGDHDFLDFNNLLVEKWVKTVPTVSLSIIKNAGHLLWIDQPEIFSKILLQHLGAN